MVNLYNKALDITELRKNAQIYNAKFKEDTSVTGRRMIMVSHSANNNGVHEFFQQVKRIQSSLNYGDYVGFIYSPFKQGHVDSFIVSNDKIFILSPYNSRLIDDDVTIIDILASYYSVDQAVQLSMAMELQNGKTRSIQADKISCGAIALKTIKTLLSPVKDGRLLIDTLKIKRELIDDQGNYLYGIRNPSIDILKISQSEKLVQEKIKAIPEEKRVLLTGKHAGMPLEEHRSRFTKYSDEGKVQSSYVDKLREKYVERANDSGNVAFLNI